MRLLLRRPTLTVKAVIVGHTLDLQEKKARDAMTPLADAFMLDADATKLDYPTLRKILEAGHSRIPVYELSASKQRRIVHSCDSRPI